MSLIPCTPAARLAAASYMELCSCCEPCITAGRVKLQRVKFKFDVIEDAQGNRTTANYVPLPFTPPPRDVIACHCPCALKRHIEEERAEYERVTQRNEVKWNQFNKRRAVQLAAYEALNVIRKQREEAEKQPLAEMKVETLVAIADGSKEYHMGPASSMVIVEPTSRIEYLQKLADDHLLSLSKEQ